MTPGTLERTITVTGTGTSAAVPDAVSVVLVVEVTGATPAEALRACGAAQADVVAALGVTASASDLSVQPEWDPERQREGRPRARSTITATLPSLTSAGEVVTAALEAGGRAARLQSLNPVVSDPGPARARAREAAFSEARRTADQYALLAGQTLGELVRLSEGEPVRGELPMRAAFIAKDSYAVAEGPTQVAVSVVASWQLGSD